MTKTTYVATAPDGSQHTRKTTAATPTPSCPRTTGPRGWTAVGFCGRADLAQKKQGEHPGSIVVECDVLGDRAPDMLRRRPPKTRRAPTTSRTARPNPRPKRTVVRSPRPTISALVKRLLMDETLDYQEIVDQVLAEFPAAKTTARSVASVAAIMRKKGVEVPLRRKPKR